MHARYQAAERMLPLVEVGRQPAGDGDVLRRRLDQIIRQAGLGVGDRVAVELDPAGVVMGDDVDHQIERRQRLELFVAEGARELPAQSGVLIHHDRQSRRAGRCGLDNHGGFVLRWY